MGFAKIWWQSLHHAVCVFALVAGGTALEPHAQAAFDCGSDGSDVVVDGTLILAALPASEWEDREVGK